MGRIDHEKLDRGHTGMEKEKKSKLGLKKKRRREKENEVSASNGDQIHADNEMMSHREFFDPPLLFLFGLSFNYQMNLKNLLIYSFSAVFWTSEFV